MYLDYPVRSVPRWGYGRPLHEGLLDRINRNRDEYRLVLEILARYRRNLGTIPLNPSRDVPEAAWNNPSFPALDAAALYGLIAHVNPARMIEIGSGYSTLFARRAVDDHALRTRITSIDPDPRVEVDSACHQIVRDRLEDTDLAILDGLAAGDVLFVDGSHRCFMNSDVTVVFLEAIPRLTDGVFVHFHDIYLPWDYPPEWADRYYSEQYLLAAALLLSLDASFQIVLPNTFVNADRRLRPLADCLLQDLPATHAERHGSSFWIRTAGKPTDSTGDDAARPEIWR